MSSLKHSYPDYEIWTNEHKLALEAETGRHTIDTLYHADLHNMTDAELRRFVGELQYETMLGYVSPDERGNASVWKKEEPPIVFNPPTIFFERK